MTSKTLKVNTAQVEENFFSYIRCKRRCNEKTHTRTNRGLTCCTLHNNYWGNKVSHRAKVSLSSRGVAWELSSKTTQPHANQVQTKAWFMFCLWAALTGGLTDHRFTLSLQECRTCATSNCSTPDREISREQEGRSPLGSTHHTWLAQC